VPGIDGTGQLFYRQVPLLARHFTVITYALRHAAIDMGMLIADLDAIVETVLAGRSAILVGESFGGALAMSYAIAHPAKVRALVVLNSFPFFAPQRRLWLASTLLRVLPVGMTAFVRRLTAFRLYSAHTHRHDVARFLELTRTMNREGYLNRLRILRTYDVRDALPRISAPTLFLAADRDHLVPSVAQAKLMARLLPGAAIRILAGHGHICLIAPDLDLSEILLEWLQSPSARVYHPRACPADGE
jgi:3-oxoadipate enol-lactonase